MTRRGRASRAILKLCASSIRPSPVMTCAPWVCRPGRLTAASCTCCVRPGSTARSPTPPPSEGCSRRCWRNRVAEAVGFRIRPATEADLVALEWGGEYRRFRRLYRTALEEAKRGERVLLVAEVPAGGGGQVLGQRD